MVKSKLFRILFLFCLLVAVMNQGRIFADNKYLINYQGQLTDVEGTPLGGTHSITFKIYDVETGGSALWEELHEDVLVEDGVLSVLLGANTALTDLPFDKLYYLEMIVDGEVMNPRQRLTSSAYALNAESAETAEKIKADAADTTAGYLSEKVDDSTITVDTNNHNLKVNKGFWQIAEVQNPSGVSSVTFNNLTPGKMYKVEMRVRQTGSIAEYQLRFNADSSNSYKQVGFSIIAYDPNVGINTPEISNCIKLHKDNSGHRICPNYPFIANIDFYADPSNNSQVTVIFDGVHFASRNCRDIDNTRGGGVYTGSLPLASLTIAATVGSFSGKVILMELNET
jgi:hypothetical protein